MMSCDCSRTSQWRGHTAACKAVTAYKERVRAALQKVRMVCPQVNGRLEKVMFINRDDFETFTKEVLE